MADVGLQIQNRKSVERDYQRPRVRHISSGSGNEPEDETLDPRIQDELEKLNKGADEINRLELELDDARSGFRQSLSESTQKLNALTKKLGSCIEKARPYYEARMRAKEAQIETQRAALRFERAMSMHEAAKEMVQLAEQGYSNKGEPFDPAWQEMLNHATMKVNEAETERIESEQEHGLTAKFYNESDQKVQVLQKDLKRSIAKSRPYFEMKAKFNQLMEDQKHFVAKLEAQVVGAKSMYSDALRNLELISDEIHRHRMEKRQRKELGIRGSGVGADSPPSLRRQSSKVEGSDSLSDSTQEIMNSQNDSNSITSSVVFSSPESARNSSYRQAIEESLTKSSTFGSINSNDYDENFDVPSLEDEYMSLPRSKSVQRQASVQSLGKAADTITEEEEDSVFSSLPKTHVIHQELSREVMNSSPTSSTGSPSRTRKSKLQGIILKIDSHMDSGLRHPSYNSNKPQRTQSMYATAPSYFKSLNSSNSGNSQVPSTSRPGPADMTNTRSLHNKTISPPEAGVSSPAKKHVSLEVSHRGNGLDIEDTSDTESIASVGPMLDDEMVEMATLDLPNESELEKEEVEFRNNFERDSWKRRSLPPHLNYLSQYLQQEDCESSSANPSVEVTNSNNEDQRLTQEKLGLTESP